MARSCVHSSCGRRCQLNQSPCKPVICSNHHSLYTKLVLPNMRNLPANLLGHQAHLHLINSMGSSISSRAPGHRHSRRLIAKNRRSLPRLKGRWQRKLRSQRCQPGRLLKRRSWRLPGVAVALSDAAVLPLHIISRHNVYNLHKVCKESSHSPTRQPGWGKRRETLGLLVTVCYGGLH